MSTKTNKKGKLQADAGPSRSWLLAVRLLLAVAVLGAGYLAWVSLSNGPVAGCGADSGCNKVLQSRWAYWLNIPVSLPALLVYLGLLGTTVLVEKRSALADQRRAWMAIIVLAVVVAGAAVWFVGLQVFVLKAFCKFCMTAHACGLVAAVLFLKNAPLDAAPAKPRRSDKAPGFFLPRPDFARLAVIGLAGVAVLVAGQSLVEKKRNVVKSLTPDNPTNFPIVSLPPTVPPVVRATPPTNALPAPATNVAAVTPTPPPVVPVTNPPAAPLAQLAAPRLLSLHGGAFQFKLDELPMIGSPDAPHVVVSLFDYTCHHCRQLHPFLVEAQRRFSNQVSILSLPMPMATNCNPSVVRYWRAHAQACEYAKLSLAVWRAKPAAFHQFDEWLMAPADPVPVAQARDYAVQLVGLMKLDSALNDPWITHQIHTDGYLYHSNFLKTGSSQLPEMMIGPHVSFGPLNSAQNVAELFEQHFGIKAER